MRTLKSQYLWNLESGRKENRRSTVFLGSNCYFFTKNYLKNLHCVQFRVCQTLEVSEYLVLSDHSHRKIEWYTLGLTAEVDNSTRRPGVKRAAWRGINQRQVITAWVLNITAPVLLLLLPGDNAQEEQSNVFWTIKVNNHTPLIIRTSDYYHNRVLTFQRNQFQTEWEREMRGDTETTGQSDGSKISKIYLTP